MELVNRSPSVPLQTQAPLSRPTKIALVVGSILLALVAGGAIALFALSGGPSQATLFYLGTGAAGLFVLGVVAVALLYCCGHRKKAAEQGEEPSSTQTSSPSTQEGAPHLTQTSSLSTQERAPHFTQTSSPSTQERAPHLTQTSSLSTQEEAPHLTQTSSLSTQEVKSGHTFWKKASFCSVADQLKALENFSKNPMACMKAAPKDNVENTIRQIIGVFWRKHLKDGSGRNSPLLPAFFSRSEDLDVQQHMLLLELCSTELQDQLIGETIAPNMLVNLVRRIGSYLDEIKDYQPLEATYASFYALRNRINEHRKMQTALRDFLHQKTPAAENPFLFLEHVAKGYPPPAEEEVSFADWVDRTLNAAQQARFEYTLKALVQVFDSLRWEGIANPETRTRLRTDLRRAIVDELEHIDHLTPSIIAEIPDRAYCKLLISLSKQCVAYHRVYRALANDRRFENLEATMKTTGLYIPTEQFDKIREAIRDFSVVHTYTLT